MRHDFLSRRPLPWLRSRHRRPPDPWRAARAPVPTALSRRLRPRAPRERPAAAVASGGRTHCGTGGGGRVLRGGAPRSVERAAGCACRGAVDGAALPVVRVHGSPRPPGPRRAQRDHPRGRDCGDDAERTAFDLARWAPTLTERVAAVDALAHHRGVDLADVTVLRHRHLGARHGGEVAEVLRLTDRRSESPMEQGDEAAAVGRTGRHRASPAASSSW